MTLVFAFAALIALCAAIPGIAVPGLSVPITLQTLGVALAGGCLGGRRGATAVVLYLAVGLLGAPVFANGASGVGVLSGASVGYLVSWPLSAWLIGTLVERVYQRSDYPSPLTILGCVLAGSFLFVHPLGIAGMWWRIPGATLANAVSNDLNFWPGDLVKSVTAAFIVVGVHRTFPRLLTPPSKFAT